MSLGAEGISYMDITSNSVVKLHSYFSVPVSSQKAMEMSTTSFIKFNYSYFISQPDTKERAVNTA